MTYTYNAPAKINIGLDVIRKREDGYHDLRMIMQTVTLFDTLTFDIKAGNNVSMTCTDSSLPIDSGNLVIKAVNMLREEFGITADIKVHLEKRIPVAAGMAGGSSDAAAAFMAVNNIFGLGLSRQDLMKRAVNLGADIPYCIMQGTALSEGIGDILTPIATLRDIYILIATPGINVSTGFVYGSLKIDDSTIHPDIDAIIRAMDDNNARETGRLLGNVLETVTIPAYPVIDDLKRLMTAHGAIGSLMSGSGPTVFGIYLDKNTARNAADICKEKIAGLFCAVTTCYSPELPH
ncbi:MAG: 4-(cytidine 5'-diphospho)-2-C-methyl-D-erythritol kinase [Lachnospiraceae bacterium]|nr:4-(cytidine 5'-diphospho)-2-C-methyl-D-erythritol kinase [Lachnospiraceae bacterium]